MFILFAEGQYVCCGNCLGVQFYGERRDFRVTAVKVADSAVASSDSAGDVSLLHDLSALSLQAIGAPSESASPPVTSSTPKGKEVILESSPDTSLRVEPAASLSDDTGARDGPAPTAVDALPRTVQAYKITARTRIVIEKQCAAPRVSRASLQCPSCWSIVMSLACSPCSQAREPVA